MLVNPVKGKCATTWLPAAVCNLRVFVRALAGPAKLSIRRRAAAVDLNLRTLPYFIVRLREMSFTDYNGLAASLFPQFFISLLLCAGAPFSSYKSGMKVRVRG